MKVCVLTNMHAPNDDRIYFKQVSSLVKKYPDITIVAPIPNDGEQPKLKKPIKFLPLYLFPGKFGRLLSILTSVKAVRKLRPDVAHFHDYDLILAVPFLRLFTNAKLIYDSHEAYPETILISPHIPPVLRSPVSSLVNIIEKNLARLCHLIITADNPTRDTFSKKGLPAATIFNFPPLQVFQKDEVLEASLRKKYEGRTVIIYQGTMGKDRGLDHMIHAMTFLKDAVPSILLLLVGLNQPAMREEADRLIDHCGVGNHVEIIPWVEHLQIASYMRIAKIGLIPWQPVEKHMKNIPIKVFEYMACGVPVLGANTPPIAHFIKESGAGRIYDSTSVDAMVNNVLDMLSDEDSLIHMRRRGLRTVSERWNWSKMEDRLLSLYRKLEDSNSDTLTTQFMFNIHSSHYMENKNRNHQRPIQSEDSQKNTIQFLNDQNAS